jgi:phage-related protein
MSSKVRKISTKIELEGESEYKKSAAAINKSLTDMGLEMKKVTAQFGENAKSTESLTAQNKLLNQQQNERQKKIDELKKVLEKLEAQENGNEEALRTYRNELTKAETELYKTQNQISANEKQMAANELATAELADETKNLTKETTESGAAAEKSGNKFESLGKVLGAVGKSIIAFGAAAAAAGIALAKMTVDASNMADELLTESQITRQSTADLQKYAYAARFVDTELNTITASMTKNIKSMQSAQSGTGAAAEAYEQLGVAITNADGSFRDSNEVYWDTIDALGKIENETERDILTMALLGKSAQELNPLINAGSAAFKAYGDEAERMGVVMGDEQINALGKFNDKLQQLQGGIQGLKNSASLIALPFLDMLAGDGVDILGDFNNAIQAANGDITKFGDIIGKTLGQVVGVITEKLPDLIQMGVNLITALVEGISGNADLLAAAAVAVVNTLINGLANMLPKLLDGAIKLIDGLARGLSESLPNLVPVVVKLILTLVQTIAENIPLIIDSALLIIEGLVKGIANALPVLTEMLPEIIITIIEGVLGEIPKIIDTAIVIIEALISGLLSALPKIWVAIPQIIQSIISSLLSMLSDINGVGIDLLFGIINGIVSAIPELVASIPQIVFSIISAFANFDEDFIDIGKNLIASMGEGIFSGVAKLWDNIKDWGGDFVGGIKDLFGIHSPSTVFAGIGGSMAEGLGVGFDKEMESVAAEMRAAIPSNFDVGSNFNVSANRSNGAEYNGGDGGIMTAGGARIVVTQNIYTPQYNYAEQQAAAAEQFRQLARAV